MKKLILCTLVSLGLTACGGDGGSSHKKNTGGSSGHTNTHVNTVVEYPVASVVNKFYDKSVSQTLYGTKDGSNFELQYTSTPNGTSNFQGKSANTFVTSVIVKENGIVVSTTSSTGYYTNNPFASLGSVNADGQVMIVNKYSTLPIKAKVGQSGSLYTAETFVDSRKSIKDSTSISTWSLEKINNSTAYLCANTLTKYKLAGQEDLTTSECYKINKQGNILGMKMTVFRQGDGFLTLYSR